MTMRFNSHPNLEGMHSFLSPSNYHWMNDDLEKLEMRYRNRMAAAHGTRLHEFAKEAILLGQKLPRSTATLNQYVNDAISFGMSPEVMLFYTVNCFGTADAIKYNPKKKELRISDLKTGTTKASMKQLILYVAIFCLEYDIRPGDLTIELRIYQNDEVISYIPELDEIVHAIDRVVTCDRYIENLKQEALL